MIKLTCMFLQIKKFLPLLIIPLLLVGLIAGFSLTQKSQEIRKKASESIQSSRLTLVGPNQVKVGEKFSVNLLLDTTADPDYTISGVDALISVGSGGLIPTGGLTPTCTLRACPAYDLPTNFCQGGQIIYSKPTDPCSCQPPPKCIMPNDDTQLSPTIEPELSYDKFQDNIPQPMPPVYRINPISLLGVSPGKIFDNYSYPGSSGITCGGLAGLKCPDGYFCSYGGNIRMYYPDQGGTCIPNRYDLINPPSVAEASGSSQIAITEKSFGTADIICTQDAKQCPDGSYVGRMPPSCEFTSCGDVGSPVTLAPKPPYWGDNSFQISGSKNFAVDENGYFKGFTGNGIFATLNFIANQTGKIEIKIIYNGDDVYTGTHIKGYRKDLSVQSQSPQERLLVVPESLNIEVVEDNSCTKRPVCLDDNPPCAVSPLPPGQTYCPTPTPNSCYYQQVQCFQAPCEPILICPTTIPGPTCIPRPPCLDAVDGLRCLMPEREGMCPPPSPTPACSIPPPGCLGSDGTVICKMAVPPGGWCPQVTSTPTCTPLPDCYGQPSCISLPFIPPGGWCNKEETFTGTLERLYRWENIVGFQQWGEFQITIGNNGQTISKELTDSGYIPRPNISYPVSIERAGDSKSIMQLRERMNKYVGQTVKLTGTLENLNLEGGFWGIWAKDVETVICVTPPDCSIMMDNTDGSKISICDVMGAPMPGTVYCSTTPTPTPTFCNYTVNPPRLCPDGFECKSDSSLLGAGGKCIPVSTPTPALQCQGKQDGTFCSIGCGNTPTCAPAGPCYACDPIPGYCKDQICVMGNPTCRPRPPCLDATNGLRCLMPEPLEGWCPVTPTPHFSLRSSLSCFPATGVIKKGDVVDVDIILDTKSGIPVYGADIWAKYDSSIFEALDSKSLPIVSTTNWHQPQTNIVDKNLGEIHLDYGNDQKAFSGNTSIGRVQFKVLRESTSIFQFIFFQQYDNITSHVSRIWGKRDGVNLSNSLTDVTNCIYIHATPTPGSCTSKNAGDANCDGIIDGSDYAVWLGSQCHPAKGSNQKCADLRADFGSPGASPFWGPLDQMVDDTDYEIYQYYMLHQQIK